MQVSCLSLARSVRSLAGARHCVSASGAILSSEGGARELAPAAANIWPAPSYDDEQLRRKRDRKLQDYLHRSAQPRACTDTVQRTRLNEPCYPEQRALLTSLRRSTETNDWEGALSVLDNIPKDPGPEWNPVYRAILGACCKAVRYNEAKRVFDLLPKRDVMSYNMMISLCGRLHRMDEVDTLLGEMSASCIAKTGVTYTTLMHAASMARQWERALDVLTDVIQRPELKGTLNLEIAYLTAISACAKSGELELSRSLLSDIRGRGLGNRAHYNALIVACGKDGAAAMEVFNEMRAAGCVPSTIDWCVLISAHRSSFDEMRNLYRELRSELPDGPMSEVWATMLVGALELDDLGASKWVLEEMKRCGDDPHSDKARSLPSLRRALTSTFARFRKARQAREARDSFSFGANTDARASSLYGDLSETDISRSSRLGEQGIDGAQTRGPPLLPAGWHSAVDPGSGREYYWRADDPNGTTTWTHPAMSPSL